MMKRTLFFSRPAYLSTKNEQLVLRLSAQKDKVQSVPIEDIGIIVLEHAQITLTNGLIAKLVQNKTIVLTCDARHLPTSMLQPLYGHTEHSKRVREQVAVSEPTKKNLWKQIVQAKINNQATHLDFVVGRASDKLFQWAKNVKSGDSTNYEAVAAAYYWRAIFQTLPDFSRNPQGEAPNNLLNYGYAILRAITARAIVGSGFLPVFGIFHHNKYNPFCLADDLMEPYRVYVDILVRQLVEKEESCEQLTKTIKTELLRLPAMDVVLDGKNSPLMTAMSRTTNSLYECYTGKKRKLLLPSL